MKQDECPSCALLVDQSEPVCPYCGYEFPEPKRGVRPMALLFVVLMALAALGGTLALLL